jgi:exopolysaccharide production protein ExoY
MGIPGSDESGQIPWWKRTLDLLLLLLLLPAVGLFFTVLALFIKVVSRGPVLFVQERIGYRGKAFQLYKFRSMHPNSDSQVHRAHLSQLMHSDSPMRKLDISGDSRLIPFGRLLRASGMDELPQLINVLKGEMSIIGPRPATTYEYAMYQPEHLKRLEALPGLTGLWQVSGKNTTTFDQMIKLDTFYVQHLSFWLDCRILLLTFPVLLKQLTDRPAPPPGSSAPMQFKLSRK